jgi:hypothetical protein
MRQRTRQSRRGTSPGFNLRQIATVVRPGLLLSLPSPAQHIRPRWSIIPYRNQPSQQDSSVEQSTRSEIRRGEGESL